MGGDSPLRTNRSVIQANKGRVRFGTFEVDFCARELRKSGLKIKLHGQPLEVLALLLERPGEVVTREQLQQKLWASDTFVDFEHGLNKAINKLRDALGDVAENPRFIETLPRLGYRFVAPVSSYAASLQEPVKGSRVKWVLVASSAGVAMLALAIYYFSLPPIITDKDTIVLADFANTTGDAVFDGTLRQGLSVQLEQSPYLSIVSDGRIRETLGLMTKQPDVRLTPEISREVCQRTGSKAVIEGSIAQIGMQYSLILKAVNCANEEVLASTEARASDKSRVLDALSKAATQLRRKLGESLSTVQKFDKPLDKATTSSLEALQAYSLGRRAFTGVYAFSAVPLFQQAIRLDPNFAMAYAMLGHTYLSLGQSDLVAENARRAYELRGRVSEREKLVIEYTYHDLVTGDLEKARAVCELWAQLYPADISPHAILGDLDMRLGRYDEAVAQWREVLRRHESGSNYSRLAEAYLNLNRIEEAKAAVREAQAKNLDFYELHYQLFTFAFLQNDAAGMAEQVQWAAGKPEQEWMLPRQANVAAYSGRLREAREFSRMAVAVAKGQGKPGSAAAHQTDAAIREGLFGNAAEARRWASAAVSFIPYQAALALALAGDASRAQALADDLEKQSSEDTLVRFNYLPTLRAQIALDRQDPSKAIELFETVAPYELGYGALLPAYLRGQAYLALHQPGQAAIEFQKILDHRGLVNNMPIGALARLQIGRAFAMQGDTTKAKAAYQDFLTLWKDADPDIPVFIAAKAEYAKLQ